MSLVSNKSKRLKKINNNIYKNEFYTVTFNNEKKIDCKTISTIEKEGSKKDKSVSFKSIEIIEVESYKKYNQIALLSFESIENECMKAYEECRCCFF